MLTNGHNKDHQCSPLSATKTSRVNQRPEMNASMFHPNSSVGFHYVPQMEFGFQQTKTVSIYLLLAGEKTITVC